MRSSAFAAVAVLFSTLSPALAGEYAVLRNGFRIFADRHETQGELVRLHTRSGTVDLAAAEVTRFEIEEYVKPPEPEPKDADPLPTERVAASPTPQELITQAAANHGLMPEFVHSVASVESAYRTAAVSHKGAIGLMQLMPGTARELGADPHNPAENADAGVRYLKQLLIRYQNTSDPVRMALAAYNAGPGAVDKYGNVPPYRETRQYVEKVLRKYLAQLRPIGKS